MGNSNINSLDPRKFLSIGEMREKQIAATSSSEHKAFPPANTLAERLHPSRQYMKVDKVIDHTFGRKSYILVPDEERGTKECAYFDAGQYLYVFVEQDGIKTGRPYSISSSPEDARRGFYRLTVRAVEGGFVSNYIAENWREGTKVELSDPCGSFTYEPLRDAKHIVCVSGGSGITPFVSLAKAVAEGSEDCDLTLICGFKTREEILFEEELGAISASSDKIKVVYVLSDEICEGYEEGNISAELIRKYAIGDYSLFVCGSQAMYAYVKGEIAKLSLPRRRVRFECFGELHGALGCGRGEIRMKVWQSGEVREVVCSADDTILQSLEKHGFATAARCRSGECGYCHSSLRSGSVIIPPEADHRRLADEKFGKIHPCCTYPDGDIEIEIPAAR